MRSATSGSRIVMTRPSNRLPMKSRSPAIEPLEEEGHPPHLALGEGDLEIREA